MKGSKAKPTIRIYQVITLTGDTLKVNAEKAIATGLEYGSWVRSVRSSQVH